MGSIASVDIILRTPPELFLPLVSLVGGLAPIVLVAEATTWLFFLVVLYLSAPLAYSLLPEVPREAPGFRAIFVGGTIAFALTFPTVAPGVMLGLGFLLIALTGACFVWYLARVHNWQLMNPSGRVVPVLSRFFQDDEIIDTHARNQPCIRSWMKARLHFIGLAFLLAIPTFPAAMITLSLIEAYPLPDLVALAWVVGSAVRPRLPDRFSSYGPIVDSLDLEGRLIDSIENATRSFQGLTLTMLISLGLIASSLYLWASVATTRLIAESIPMILQRGLSASLALYSWNAVGIPVVFLSAGMLTAYGWLIEFGRLPAYLDRSTGADSRSTASHPRPTSLFVVSAIMAAGTMGFLLHAIGPTDGSIGQYLAAHVGYGIGWPLVIFIGWRVRSRRSPSVHSSFVYEPLWIAGALVMLIYALQVPITLAQPTTEFIMFLVMPPLLAILLLGLSAMYRIDADEESSTGWRRYGLAVFCIGAGAVLVITIPLVSAEYTLLVVSGAGILIVGGLLFAAINYREDTSS